MSNLIYCTKVSRKPNIRLHYIDFSKEWHDLNSDIKFIISIL